MLAQMTSSQATEFEAYIRVEAVPETEIEIEQQRLAQRAILNDKAKMAFDRMLRACQQSPP